MGPPRPVRGWFYFSIFRQCSYITGNTPTGLHGLIRGFVYYFYVSDVRKSQETYLWASTACYGVGYTFMYVYDVRASQETPIDHHDLLWG
jgi:hypothetical protein